MNVGQGELETVEDQSAPGRCIAIRDRSYVQRYPFSQINHTDNGS